MRLWVNILSTSDAIRIDQITPLVKSKLVPVFSTVDKRFIGKTLQYEIRNVVDLWAELELDSASTNFERAAGLVLLVDGLPTLEGVIATNLPRDVLRKMKIDCALDTAMPL